MTEHDPELQTAQGSGNTRRRRDAASDRAAAQPAAWSGTRLSWLFVRNM